MTADRTDVQELPLDPAPDADWQREVDQILERNAWLRKKVDRRKRQLETAEYIAAYLPQLKREDFTKGLVVDIGTGPGDFLEHCRHHGHDIMGVEAPTGEGGMGNDYVAYSHLMHQRQGIPCLYERWLDLLVDRDEVASPGSVAVFNSRGSMEQCFSEFMVGEPHDKHQDAKRLAWDESDDCRRMFSVMAVMMHDMLRPGGLVHVHANGAKNTDWYDIHISAAFVEAGFMGIDVSEDGRRHKWQKAD